MNNQIIIVSSIITLLGSSLFSQSFKPVQIDPFGISKPDTMYGGILIGDITKDGLFDLMYYESNTEGIPKIKVNKGTKGMPDFTNVAPLDFFSPINNQIGLGMLFSYNSNLFDLDLDGDLDHIGAFLIDDSEKTAPYYLDFNRPESNFPPNQYLYFFNVGQSVLGNTIGLIGSAPAFNYEIFCFGDLDGDNAPDILAIRTDILEYKEAYAFYPGDPTTLGQKVTFDETSVESPFGLNRASMSSLLFSSIALLDFDLDGDLDLFILKPFGDWAFRRNIGTKFDPFFDEEIANPFGLTPLNGIQQRLFAYDINDDGFLDLIANDDKSIYYFEYSSTIHTQNQTIHENIKIYPNPANEAINIEIISQHNNQKIEITILDVNGRFVSTRTSESHSTIHMPIDALPSGMYWVEIKKEGQVPQRQTFIKQ